MKPAWDDLAGKFNGEPSLVIADVDCTEEKDLCEKQGVTGFPTLKFFTAKNGKEGEKYEGPRTLDALTQFVEEELLVKCQLDTLDACSDKEKGYIEKMKVKTDDAVQKELARLDSMKDSNMAKEQKAWVSTRMHLLELVKEIKKSEEKSTSQDEL